jgi:hypothetical protein
VQQPGQRSVEDHAQQRCWQRHCAVLVLPVQFLDLKGGLAR